LRGDLAFHAPQDERLRLLAQLGESRVVSLLDGKRVTFAESAAPRQKAAVREVEDAPELFESIFERGPGERYAKLSFQPISGARNLAVGILDGLCLVEHDGVPRLLGQAIGIKPQNGVARDGQIGLRVDLSLRPLVESRAETGAKTLRFDLPVVDDGL